MDKNTAVKKLHKILGKGFGYRVDPKALLREERDEARAALKGATAERDKLRAECEARRQAVLDADKEYQERYEAYKAARKQVDQLSGKLHSYRVTVGNTSNAGGFGFFHVKAEGDNWEEVLEKVAKG